MTLNDVIAGQKFVQEDTRPTTRVGGDVFHPQLRCGSGYETRQTLHISAYGTMSRSVRRFKEK